MQRACSRPQGTSESRVDGSSFRGRTDVRHRLRLVKTSSCEEEEVKGEESFKSSGSSEEETDLAAALRKKWLGSGTTAVVKERQEDSDSPFTKKKRSRFAMIERKHKDSRRDTSKKTRVFQRTPC